MRKYLNVDRLEFAVTYRCNSNCEHCNVKHKKKMNKPIDKYLAVEIVNKISKKYHPQSIMTFGGEPLLHPEIVCAIHNEAKKSGISKRQVITNGYWFNDKDKVSEIVKQLKAAGVNNILVSVDAFHQEYIPLDIVKNTVETLIKEGFKVIKWNPCWVVNENHNNQYNIVTKNILKELDSLQIESASGNIVCPEGSTIENLSTYMPVKQYLPKGRCEEMPYTDPLDSITSISIEPNGDVKICRGFSIGNVFKADIIDILENYNPYANPEMRIILEKGIEGLMELGKKSGIKPLVEDYYSICQMCISIRGQLKGNEYFLS